VNAGKRGKTEGERGMRNGLLGGGGGASFNYSSPYKGKRKRRGDMKRGEKRIFGAEFSPLILLFNLFRK